MPKSHHYTRCNFRLLHRTLTEGSIPNIRATDLSGELMHSLPNPILGIIELSSIMQSYQSPAIGKKALIIQLSLSRGQRTELHCPSFYLLNRLRSTADTDRAYLADIATSRFLQGLWRMRCLAKVRKARTTPTQPHRFSSRPKQNSTRRRNLLQNARLSVTGELLHYYLISITKSRARVVVGEH